MRITRILPIMLAGTLGVAGVHAAEPQADLTGQMAAQTCAGCHGTQGYIEGSAFVPLAGMDRERFITAMEMFADGTRPSTLMGPLARTFSDEEIAAMADYFAEMPQERPAKGFVSEE